ncbi:MAG: hypothetical protein HQL26_04995 [Candidatus Omnitrophica bacterium]|nr:hypothetical protein [Candidatus Omnitrophota bacterium]
MSKYLNRRVLLIVILLLGAIGINSAYAAVSIAPRITTQPVSATVTAPTKATFKLVATGTPAPKYQWVQSIKGGAFVNITGAIGSSFTTAATTAVNSGTKYKCVVSNAAGSITSSIAILTVNVVPNITTQPVNVTVTEPTTAMFKVVASGTPTPTYQWMQSVNAGTFTNISGATSASYTTAASKLANSGTKYKCVVSNVAGSVTSSIATLTVNVIPNITTQPVNVTVTAPTTATFKVVASGTPAPTYQWMQEASGASLYTAMTGATSDSYTTSATTVAVSGTKYKCVVANIAGSTTSTEATLTVNPTPVAPNITSQPVSLTVTAPVTATFSVTANGVPTPTYQWMQSVNAGAFTNISGATSATYTTPATTLANSGTKYECMVTNIVGKVASAAATLTVNPTPAAPSIKTHPVSATVTAPATATFSVTAIGTPVPTYQWIQSINGGAFTNIAGATNASYTTPATTIANNGTQYECVVTNSLGSEDILKEKLRNV